MRLPFPFQHALQRLAALFGLPDLIGILVLIKREKLLVSVQSELRLLQLIVANCANKPDACARLFHFGYLIERRQRGRVVPAQKKCGAEVFPIIEIFAVETHGDAQFFFRGGKVASLKKDAPQTTVQLSIVWRQRQSLLQSGNRGIPFLPGNLHVRAKLQRIDGRLLTGIQAIEFRERRIVVFLLD